MRIMDKVSQDTSTYKGTWKLSVIGSRFVFFLYELKDNPCTNAKNRT